MYDALTDKELLQGMMSDDHDAFAALVHRYRTHLYRVIIARVRSDDDAKDILQEVFISFWNKRKTLNLRGSIMAYLSQAVRYAVIDWQIQQGRYLTKINLLLPDEESPSVDSELIANELKGEILDLTNKLPLTVRAVFRLSRFEHKTNGEIAKELNLSDKTIRNSLSIALHHLRKYLDTSLVIIITMAVIRLLSKY